MIHSFLMIGQSNMAGCGAIDEALPINTDPSTNLDFAILRFLKLCGIPTKSLRKSPPRMRHCGM